MEERKPVIVTGIEIPFSDLVTVLIKLALAAIPAAIILFILGTFASIVVLALMAAKGY